VAIVFDLQGTQTFQEVLAELHGGRLRIGLHVTAFANGASESLVNLPLSLSQVPEPTAFSLMLLGGIAYPGIRGRGVS
jgi:hypothetical protein